MHGFIDLLTSFRPIVTWLLASLLLVHFQYSLGQDSGPNLLTLIEELRDFVSIPNHGLDQENIRKNIGWAEAAFARRGLQTQILTTTGNPLFYAEKVIAPDLPAILFYMHLDGQAVDPSKWYQENPFQVVLKTRDSAAVSGWRTIDWDRLRQEVNPEWRLFGRSVADDKAPIVAFLHALDRLLETARVPAFNIKVLLDAEEELGSPSLAEAVRKYRELLQADVLIINDGPVHISGEPTLIFGCRGNMRVDLTVYGPITPQHSGHYGNYAPNPVFRLARLLASMKDDEGRVIIPGYYDGVTIDPSDKFIMEQVPDDPGQIMNLLQIAEPEKVGANYQESLQYPSLNARGILSGWVGNQARTIVPDYATAALDIRLVPESDPIRLTNLISHHIQDQGYYLVDHEPTREERLTYPKIAYFNAGEPTLAFRTPMSSPAGTWLSEALSRQSGKDPIRIRMMGGTVPVAAFISTLQIPAVIVPMVNADNNQHSPNENMRIGHLQKALEIFEAILTTSLKQ